MIDAVDARRIKVARTVTAVVVTGFLWAALGLRLAELWCGVGSCAPGSIGIMVAWGATAAVVAGRYAWSMGRGERVAALAFLGWSAWCVTFPAASALLLAGPFLDSLLGLGFGFGFLVHWSIVGAVHVAGLMALAHWAQGARLAASVPRT